MRDNDNDAAVKPVLDEGCEVAAAINREGKDISHRFDFGLTRRKYAIEKHLAIRSDFGTNITYYITPKIGLGMEYPWGDANSGFSFSRPDFNSDPLSASHVPPRLPTKVRLYLRFPLSDKVSVTANLGPSQPPVSQERMLALGAADLTMQGTDIIRFASWHPGFRRGLRAEYRLGTRLVLFLGVFSRFRLPKTDKLMTMVRLDQGGGQGPVLPFFGAVPDAGAFSSPEATFFIPMGTIDRNGQDSMFQMNGRSALVGFIIRF